MERYKRFVEKLYNDYITNDFDRLMPVVGGEGVGKSTLMLQTAWLYDKVRGRDPTPESVLDYVVFDSREAFRDKLLAADPGDPIIAMDAAHILHNKEQMDPDQIDTEKSLLDIRIENYFILLGYQDWADIPSQLRRRRAENLVRIPERGYLYGYSRSQLDQKYNDLSRTEWPDPALRDTFPSLEGTRLWDRFQEVDAKRKRSRLKAADEGEDEVQPQDVVEDILSGNIGQFVELNEFQERAYFSKPLIKFDYPELSDQEADQVTSALRREVDPAQYVDGSEGTDTPTPTSTG